MMKIAVLDPASGIAGDMFLGALVDVGLDKAWLERLPSTLGLSGVDVRIADVQRSHVHCVKVDFDIPPQPHGRAVSEIHRLIDAVKIPDKVARSAHAAFEAIAAIESEIHGVAPDELHLHEVGAVDAILDIIGSIWGVEMLGIERIYNTKVSLGDGTVKTAHGVLPVPAPATIRLLEGFNVRHGPPGSGELTTPTGAALLRVLSKGEPPQEYRPRQSGYGAGTRDIHGQLNALRIIVGEATVDQHDHDHHHREHVHTEHLHVLSADIDDMSPEELAGAADVELQEPRESDVTRPEQPLFASGLTRRQKTHRTRHPLAACRRDCVSTIPAPGPRPLCVLAPPDPRVQRSREPPGPLYPQVRSRVAFGHASRSPARIGRSRRVSGGARGQAHFGSNAHEG